MFTALFDPDIGLLAGSTVILATNGSTCQRLLFPVPRSSSADPTVHRLAQADHIIVLSGGNIIEQGSCPELMASEGPTCDLIREFASVERHASVAETSAEEESDEELKKEEKLSREDEGRRGGTSWGTYGFYFGAIGLRKTSIASAGTIVLSIMPVIVNVYQNYWSSAIVIVSFSDSRPFFRSS